MKPTNECFTNVMHAAMSAGILTEQQRTKGNSAADNDVFRTFFANAVNSCEIDKKLFIKLETGFPGVLDEDHPIDAELARMAVIKLAKKAFKV